MSDPTRPLPPTIEYYRPSELYLPRPQKRRYWLHTLLFLATFFTTLVVGAHMEFNFQNNLPAFSFNDDVLPILPVDWALAQPSRLLLGLPFASTLMLILLAHEMGHYLYCRYYGVYATLPFFIPFPTLFGTAGAFIRIRSPIPSRNALFDIGIAGPIAGFLVAAGVLVFALPQSKMMPLAPVASDVQLGYPLIFHLAWATLPLAKLRAGSASLQGVYLHPAVIAAWVGMLATALNLLPGGQLDGGHIVFALSPRAHKIVSRVTILALIPLAIYFWTGWLLWAVVLRITGMRHPIVPEWPGVTGGRRWVALFGLVMLVLTFMPAPVASGSLLDVLREWHSRH
jgi:membrane-associated protease RseP (regulator of RpoE activity)